MNNSTTLFGRRAEDFFSLIRVGRYPPSEGPVGRQALQIVASALRLPACCFIVFRVPVVPASHPSPAARAKIAKGGQKREKRFHDVEGGREAAGGRDGRSEPPTFRLSISDFNFQPHKTLPEPTVCASPPVTNTCLP